MSYQQFTDALKNDFQGFHLEIHLFPAGGAIDASGCETCGTDEECIETITWGPKRKAKTADQAVQALKAKLGIA